MSYLTDAILFWCCPVAEYFTLTWTASLRVMATKFGPLLRAYGLIGKGGVLPCSCQKGYDKGPRCTRRNSKDHPVQSPFTPSIGYRRLKMDIQNLYMYTHMQELRINVYIIVLPQALTHIDIVIDKYSQAFDSC